MRRYYPICLLRVFVGLAVATQALCQSANNEEYDQIAWVDTSLHESRFLELDGFRLNYLEWGSGDKIMVIVPGLGDSPHLFDDFAPQFSENYRVIAYARRGHGKSTYPPDAKFDNETLTADLRQLMDALQIDSATLVGFSLGGNEINRFATLYPRRIEALIYLDCLDHTDSEFRKMRIEWPIETTATLSRPQSAEEIYEWLLTKGPRLGLTKSDALWASTIDAVKPDPAGGVRLVPGAELSAALFESAMNYRKEYSKIVIPSLALFTLPKPSHLIPKDSSKEFSDAVIEFVQSRIHPWIRRSIRRFEEEAPNGRAVTFPQTHHVLFLDRTEEVITEIRTFLAEI